VREMIKGMTVSSLFFVRLRRTERAGKVVGYGSDCDIFRVTGKRPT